MKLRVHLTRTLTAIVATALLSSAALADSGKSYWEGVRQAGVLKCGAASAPPFLIRDPANGNYTGYFAALCKEFGAVLGVKTKFVDTTWDNMVAGLQAGKWDLAPALDRTPERAIAINFSEPVSDATYTLAYNKKNPKVPSDAKSVADVDKEGLKIAVIAGSAQDKAVTPLIHHATLLRLPTNEEVNLAVKTRRADIVVNESAMNLLFAKATGPSITLLSPKPAIVHRGVGFGLPRSLSAADVKVLDIFIQDAKATGEVKRLIDASIDEVVANSK